MNSNSNQNQNTGVIEYICIDFSFLLRKIYDFDIYKLN